MTKKRHKGQSKAFMAKIRAMRGKNRHSNHVKGGVTMARRRHKRSRRYGRGSGKGFKGIMVGAIAYGALRQKVSDALTPVTSKIPLGTLSDELVMGVISYMLMKKTKGIPSEIGKAGLTIELARVGEALINGQAFNLNGGVSSNGTVQTLG